MNPNSSSLFHFTGCLSYLKDIIAKGFRYSYSYEVYPKAVIRNDKPVDNKSFFFPSKDINNAVAIPMICFCDIPLTRTLIHREFYKNYAIGISKEMASSIYGNVLNPISYLVGSNSFLSLSDISVVKDQIIDGCHNLNFSVNYLLAMSKPYHGEILDDGDRCFYDENEWRIFLPDDKDSVYKWHWDIHFDTRDEFKIWRKPFNEALNSSEFGRLTFVKKKTLQSFEEEELVRFFTHIIVSDDSEIKEIVDFILDSNNPIFGYKYIKKSSRQLLASKVTSVERIEKDY